MMQEDYQVIEELPCVFVAGGCEETMSRWWEKEGKRVKLIGIKEQESVLVNIDSWEVETINFDPAAVY